MASFRDTQQAKKEPLAHLINERKEVLFGKFNDSRGITKTTKKEAWIDIHEKLMSLDINLIPPNKDWSYLRDVVWRNMVDSLKKKMDRKRQSGAGRVDLAPHEKIVLGE